MSKPGIRKAEALAARSDALEALDASSDEAPAEAAARAVADAVAPGWLDDADTPDTPATPLPPLAPAFDGELPATFLAAAVGAEADSFGSFELTVARFLAAGRFVPAAAASATASR